LWPDTSRPITINAEKRDIEEAQEGVEETRILLHSRCMLAKYATHVTSASLEAATVDLRL